MTHHQVSRCRHGGLSGCKEPFGKARQLGDNTLANVPLQAWLLQRMQGAVWQSTEARRGMLASKPRQALRLQRVQGASRNARGLGAAMYQVSRRMPGGFSGCYDMQGAKEWDVASRRCKSGCCSGCKEQQGTVGELGDGMQVSTPLQACRLHHMQGRSSSAKHGRSGMTRSKASRCRPASFCASKGARGWQASK